MSLPSFGRCDPGSYGPWWTVAHVLLMPALKLGDPVRVLILVETHNFPGPALRLASPFHPKTPPRTFCTMLLIKNTSMSCHSKWQSQCSLKIKCRFVLRGLSGRTWTSSQTRSPWPSPRPRQGQMRAL
jgi:hypothetical protein